MSELINRLAKGYWNLLNGSARAAAEAWDDQDWRCFFKNIGLFLLFLADGAGVTALFLLLLWKVRGALLAILMPLFFVALLIASYFENHKKPGPVTPPVVHMSIDETRARATRTYRSMAQTAFLLLTDLCRYLPGLVKPFSLASVEAPVHFYITASMVTLFHFTIGKGENDAPVSTIEEILGSIITQHLQALDLPISVPAVYTSVDGSTWPGLVVDGVYDLGQKYRIDFAITNEAMVSRLKSRAASDFEGDTVGQQAIHDEDFD